MKLITKVLLAIVALAPIAAQPQDAGKPISHADPPAKKVVAAPPPGAIGQLPRFAPGVEPFALSRDARFFTSGSTLWDVTTGGIVAESRVGDAAYVFSPLGDPWGVAVASGGIRIFEVKGNRTLATIPRRGAWGPLLLRLRADGGGDRVLLVAPVSRDEGVVEVWDLARPARILRVVNRDLFDDVCWYSTPNWLAASENGRRLFWLNAARTIVVWDPSAPGKAPRSFPWNPDQPAAKRKQYHQFSPQERREAAQIAGASLQPATAADAVPYTQQSPDAIIASPDGETLAGLEYEPAHPLTPVISLWRAASGKRCCVLRPAPWGPYEEASFAFSPAGREFMMLSYHTHEITPEPFRILVWDIDTGRRLREYLTRSILDFAPILESGDVYLLAWTRYCSFRTLSHGSWLGYSRWAWEMPQWPARIVPIVSPDGLFFVECRESAVLREVASGRRVTLVSEDREVYPVAFSVDGKTLITETGPKNPPSVTFWSVPKLVARERLQATDDAALVAALLGDDAARAQAAAAALAAKGDSSVPRLEEIIRERPSRERIQGLVRQLDANTLAARRAASAALARYGELIEAELTRAAEKDGSAEVRHRAAELLAEMRRNTQRHTAPEVRVVQVLATIRSPRAITALHAITERAASARVRAAALFSLAQVAATSANEERRQDNGGKSGAN